VVPHTSTGGADDGKGNCTFCHFAGHPLDDVAGTAFIIPNSTSAGIDYRSQGIHLQSTIEGRGPFTTEAELCWGCHDAKGISEWGADDGPANVSTVPDNGSNYNYGLVNGGSSSAWVVGGTGAPWASSEANFSYKSGKIQSTHSTDPTGQATLSGSDYDYFEQVDTVAKIHCSNCHDVHDLAKAAGDTAKGAPYLRGSWIRNPYKEDGAPWNKTYAVTNTKYDAVPRAGHPTDPSQGNETGGYQIDQNNDNPTKGLSRATSSGLCTLCHSGGVDDMNKFSTGPGDSTGLWIGALGTANNGHSNATLGGTAAKAENIFGNGIGGRAVPNATATDGDADSADIFDMGLQVMPNVLGTTTEYAYGYRTGENANPGGYLPEISTSRPRAYNEFVWGVTVDQTSVDVGYHAFTCSKCHNPHASRLPKLLITNCLDTRQNTWQANKSSQTEWTSTADQGEKTATHNTAQNCHRYDPNEGVDGVGGWNKVSPWRTKPL
jgi:hypothetical protein